MAFSPQKLHLLVELKSFSLEACAWLVKFFFHGSQIMRKRWVL